MVALAMLALLAASPAPMKTPLAMAGRPVTVPAACSAEREARGATVNCGSTSFVTWIETADEPSAREAVDKAQALAADLIRTEGTLLYRKEVACSIVGIRSTCTLYRGRAKGSPVVMVVGMVHGKTWAAAFCTATGGEIISAGACGAVFSEP